MRHPLRARKDAGAREKMRWRSSLRGSKLAVARELVADLGEALAVVVAEVGDLRDGDVHGLCDQRLLLEGRVGRVAPFHPGTERPRQLLVAKGLASNQMSST
jgi:hypothetical protein